MSKGSVKINRLGGQGLVRYPVAGEIDFLYVASVTKDPKWNLGDGIELADGRRFRYCKAGAAGVVPETGAVTTLKTITVAVAPAQAVGAGAVGNHKVTLTVASGDGAAGTGLLAEDELKGGTVVIGNGSAQHPQMRGILGNTAVAAPGGVCTLTLDAALTIAVTVNTTTIETLCNPYATVVLTNDASYQTFIGVPCVVATVGQYFWLQTKGKCWITSDTHTCDQAYDRDIYFVGNGSVVSGYDVPYTSSHPLMYQKAGVAVDVSGSSASNAPMVNLQLE